MELLAPAGNPEKLKTVYHYGADAAYLGLGPFSLRQRADNVDGRQSEGTGDDDPGALSRQLAAIKGRKRLYGALNIYFQETDLAGLDQQLDWIAALPLDAVIVSDIGVVPRLRSRLPGVELHLSTQANCTNSEAARLYRDLGFSRIVPARELSLSDIEAIKRAVPDLEVEVFVHGAMCLAYSGRCLLSAWLADRSGNRGDCAHSCRWNYRLAVEEKERPGEYLPVEEGSGFTTILSPKDLCMIDHLAALKEAGVDSIKIEGRVKSSYYAAVVTRAYRKELDRIREGGDRALVQPFIAELWNVSHREYSTGFYFGDPDAVAPGSARYAQRYRFLGTVGKRLSDHRFEVDVKNGFAVGEEIEFIGPDLPAARESNFELRDTNGAPVQRLTHHSGGSIETTFPVEPGFLIRRRVPDRE